MPERFSTVTDGDFEISSNVESADEMKEILGVGKAEEAAEPEEIEVRQTDGDGKKARDAKGKFVAKPIPPGAEPRRPEAQEAEEKAPAEEKKAIKPSPEAKEEAEAKVKEKEEREAAKAETQERIQQLLGDRKRAQEERNALLAEVRALREEVTRSREPQQAKPKHEALPDNPKDPRPKEDDFDNYAEFVEARARWAARQEYSGVRERAEVEQRARMYQAAIQQSMTNFFEKVNAAGGAKFVQEASFLQDMHPSFTLEQGERPGPMNALADEIIRSKDPIPLIRYLSNNEDALHRFSTVQNKAGFDRLMGKVEAAMEAEAQANTAPASIAYTPRANGPVRPVTGASSTTDGELDPDKTSFEEWFSKMNAREREARRR